MAITVHIPTPLRPFVNNQDEIKIEAEGTVQNILDSLAAENENLKKHLFNDEGQIRNFVNVYVNDEDIRFRDGPKTDIKSGDVLSIVPSIAGGNCPACNLVKKAGVYIS